MKEVGPREHQLREMREARLKRNSPNPFEDAARGRDFLPPRKPHEMPSVAGTKPSARSSTVELSPHKTKDVGSSPAVPTKRGRPPKGEKREKPWEAAGMSKASWYRQKEKSK